MSSASATGSTRTAPGCLGSARVARSAIPGGRQRFASANRESPHPSGKGVEWPGQARPSRVRILLHDLPGAIVLAAGRAVGLLLAAGDDGVAGVFAAVAAIAGGVAARRRHPVAVSFVLALPHHRLVVRRM